MNGSDFTGLGAAAFGDASAAAEPGSIGEASGLGLLSGLGALSAFIRTPEVNGLYYNHKVVKLDGYKFVGCRFDSCRLMVESTNFEMVHCIVDAECVIEFGGEVIKIVQLFLARYPWAYEQFPGFVPVRHSDKTFSISWPPLPQ